MKRASQLSRAQLERIAKNAGIPLRQALPYLGRTSPEAVKAKEKVRK